MTEQEIFDSSYVRFQEVIYFGTGQIHRDSESGQYFVAPLIDPDNVNERRLRVGLTSIEDYVYIWNIKWKAELKRLKGEK